MNAFAFLGNTCGHRLSRTPLCFCAREVGRNGKMEGHFHTYCQSCHHMVTGMISFTPSVNDSMPDEADEQGRRDWDDILKLAVTR